MILIVLWKRNYRSKWLSSMYQYQFWHRRWWTKMIKLCTIQGALSQMSRPVTHVTWRIYKGMFICKSCLIPCTTMGALSILIHATMTMCCLQTNTGFLVETRISNIFWEIWFHHCKLKNMDDKSSENTCIWVNYNISLTWIKAIWGWFPSLTMIPVRSQWGRYNLPRCMLKTAASWVCLKIWYPQFQWHRLTSFPNSHNYPLVNIQKAVENGDLLRWFTH